MTPVAQAQSPMPQAPVAKMDFNTFASKIKAQYPQYNALDNFDLANKMLAKYPQYEAQVQRPSILENIGKGINDTGKAIGDTVTNFLFPKNFQNSIAGVGSGTLQNGLTGEAAQYAQEQAQGQRPTDLQAGGAALQSAINFGSMAMPVAGTALGRVGQAGAIGAGFGATNALQDANPTPGSVLQGGLMGAATGAATGGALEGLGAGLSKLTSSDGLAGKLAQTGINQSKKELAAGKDMSQFALENLPIGSTKAQYQVAQSNVKQLSDGIDSLLVQEEHAGEMISKKALLKQVASEYGQTGGAGTITGPEVEKILTRVAPQAKGLLSNDALTIADANRLRKILDRTLGAKFFLASSEPPFTKDVLGTFTNILRGKVQKTAPETQPIFEELSKWITTRNALKGSIDTAARRGASVSLKDLIGGVGGGVVAGLPGAAAGYAAEKVITNPAVNFAAGKSLYGLGNLGRAVSPQIVPAARTGLLNALINKPRVNNY